MQINKMGAVTSILGEISESILGKKLCLSKSGLVVTHGVCSVYQLKCVYKI